MSDFVNAQQQAPVDTGASAPVASDGRPKLQLKPRSAAASTTVSSTTKSSIFGAARPREEILKEKGIDVKEVEKKLDERTKRMPKMNKEQQEEYDAAEAEVAFCKSELEKAENEEAKKSCEEELVKKTVAVDDLVESFRVVTIKSRRTSSDAADPTSRGERPFVRQTDRRNRYSNNDSNYNNGGGGNSGYNNNNNNRGGNFSSFGGRNNNDRGDRVCYNCGESGHMSRDCRNPSNGSSNNYNNNSRGGAGSFNNNSFGGGERQQRTCYNCGEPGHESRECPKDGAGGGSNYGNQGGFNSAFGGGGNRGGGGGGDRSCYNCGESGHISRNCPTGQGGNGGNSGGYGNY